MNNCPGCNAHNPDAPDEPDEDWERSTYEGEGERDEGPRPLFEEE